MKGDVLYAKQHRGRPLEGSGAREAAGEELQDRRWFVWGEKSEESRYANYPRKKAREREKKLWLVASAESKSYGKIFSRRGVVGAWFLAEGRSRVGSVLEFEGEGDDGVCLIAAEGPALWSRVGGAARFYQLN